eukprot:COSAG02_NODE_6020_length_3870_cov_25.718377_5_plen_45_part_01
MTADSIEKNCRCIRVMVYERSLISVPQVKEPTRTPARRQFHHTIL